MITEFEEWAAELEAEIQERGVTLEGCDAEWQGWFEEGLSIDEVIAKYMVWSEEELREAEGDYQRKRSQEEAREVSDDLPRQSRVQEEES